MKSTRSYAIAIMLAGALALPAATAHAEGYNEASGTSITSQAFKSLDMDRSGTLSETEFDKHASARIDFDEADINSDGRLTLSEAQSVKPERPSMDDSAKD